MAIDYTLPLGQVRLLISDVDETNLALEDAMITGYLSINAGSIRRAAADALDAIADSEILISKVIKTLDFATDGASAAGAIRVHAQRLRDQAEDDDFMFDIVDYNPYPWNPELVNGEHVWGL